MNNNALVFRRVPITNLLRKMRLVDFFSRLLYDATFLLTNPFITNLEFLCRSRKRWKMTLPFLP